MRLSVFLGVRPLAAFMLAVTALLPIAQAQETKESLPTVKEVLKASLDAISSPELLASQKSRTAIGTMSIPAMQLSGPMKIYAAEPNLMLVDITIPGVGKSVQGFNGTVGWQIDPARGPSLMEGDVLEQFKREADYHKEENALKYYDEIKIVGVQEFNGQECLELHFKKGERNESRFYNRKTYLLEGSKGLYPTPMGEIPVQTVLSEYKDFGGVKVPTRTSMQMQSLGIEQILLISEVTFNDVEPTVFDLPPAIEALASAPKETKEPQPAEESKDG